MALVSRGGMPHDPVGGVVTRNPSLVTRMSARRSWTFRAGEMPHVLELGPDSIWNDLPSEVWLDGVPTRIKWRMTHRGWGNFRWEWHFEVGASAGTLICKRRRVTRRRLLRLSWRVGVARLRGDWSDYEHAVRRTRRTVYFLVVDGRSIPRPSALG